METHAAPSPAHRKRVMIPLMPVVVVAVLVVVIGFVHVVHGGHNLGFALCAKDGWALENTLVDLDDFIDKPLLALLDRAKVVRAMFACGQLERPAGLGQDRDPPSRSSSSTSMSRRAMTDDTRRTLKRYVFEAYPSWAAAHPDQACPDSLAELSKYTTDVDASDAWGEPLKMMCGQSLPPGARGLAVLSRGEDGREGTKDDVKSWE